MIDRTLKGISAALALAGTLASGTAAAEAALWSVSGRENTVYLYGSVHILPEGGFAIDGKLAEAWKDIEKVCLEIDPSAIDEAELQRITLARVQDPQGRDLFTLLGPDADKAKAAAATAGIPLEAMAPFEPWFAGMMLSIMALQQRGYDIEHGVEKIIESTAILDQKPICAFETADEQLALFDTMPLEQQSKFLLQSIDEIAEIDNDMRRMLTAWKAGDEQSLATLFAEEFDGYEDLVGRLVNDRNARWAEQVSEILNGKEDVLVVVGAGHMVGDHGLPALLAKRGYKVKRN